MATLTLDNDDVALIINLISSLTDKQVDDLFESPRESIKFLRDRLKPFSGTDNYVLSIVGTTKVPLY